MTNKSALGMCLVAVSTAAALGACGSSGSKATSPGTGTGSGTSTGSGASIRIMNVGAQSPSAAFGGISFPYGATGVKAAAAAINAAGGIDGHMIQVDVCDTKGSPNGSAQCGRKAVANKDIAVVGTFDPLGAPQLLGVLEAAQIPYIGGLPTTAEEFKSPVSFQFDPGPVPSSTALAKVWSDNGCKKVSAILPANPGNDTIAEQQKQQAQTLGVSVQSQLVKPGIADVTPSLSTAMASNPDCFTYGGDGQTNVKYILGLHKLGFTGKILTSAGSLTPQFLGPLGAAANGIIILNSTLQPSSPDPLVQQFNKELSTYLKDDKTQTAINSNEFAQDGWSSVQLVKQALTGSKEMSAKALLTKIPTMCDVNVGNVYPHVNFCKPVAESKSLPRVYNDQWQYFAVKDGKYVPVDNQWHDLTSTLPKG